MLTIPRIPSHLRFPAGPVRSASLALFCALAAAPAFGQPERPWLHVQVQDESDETRVEVNLPLSAVEALADSLGERVLDEVYDDIEEAAEDGGRGDLRIEDLRALWQALRDEPGAWVEIEEAGEGRLRARMDAGEVRIVGSGGDGALNIRFPAAVGDALFAGGDDDDLDIPAALRSLADHEGNLVTVTGGDAQVRIWIGPQ